MLLPSAVNCKRVLVAARSRIALVASLALVAQACSGGGDVRPNVLLVTVDTLRADHLGSYGFPFATSPNIDALAAGSVVFDRAVASATTTAPAHASMMTSRYTRGHSIGYLNGSTRLEGAVTLAERFRDAGFSTAGFVGNMVLRRRSGLDRGFEVYDDDLQSNEHNRRGFPERRARATTARAIAWLEQARAPFFLWVHYQDPHGPYLPPPGFRGRVKLPRKPGEEPLPVLQNDSGYRGIPAYQALEGAFWPSEYESGYADEIFFADRHIGELLGAAEARASTRPLVVLLTADHGESFGENELWFVHAFTTMPDLAHVPFILRAPGLAPERRREVVSHVDVMPTLLELAGIPFAEDPGAAGLALGPYLRSGEPLPDRRVYCDIGRELSAYASGDFVRVLRAASAWGEAIEDGGPDGPPAWLHFAWHEDGSWSLAPDDPDAKPAVQAYMEAAAPMLRREPLSEGDVEGLKALGYVDRGRDG